MPLQLLSRSSSPLNLTRRVLIGLALVVVGYLAAVITSSSPELPFGVSVGSAAAVKHAAANARRADSISVDASESPRDFDYFPDDYSNQAKEAAEPIETF